MPPELRLVERFCNTAVLLHELDALGTLAGANDWLVENGWDALEREDELVALRAGREEVRAYLADRADPHARRALNRRADEHWSRAHIDDAGNLSLVSKAGAASPVADAVAAVMLHGLGPTGLRLRTCSSDQCRYVFWDGSRSRTRQWCDMNVCGARNKMRQYRSRQPPATI